MLYFQNKNSKKAKETVKFRASEMSPIRVGGNVTYERQPVAPQVLIRASSMMNMRLGVTLVIPGPNLLGGGKSIKSGGHTFGCKLWKILLQGFNLTGCYLFFSIRLLRLVWWLTDAIRILDFFFFPFHILIMVNVGS